jgi:hypothetical protein
MSDLDLTFAVQREQFIFPATNEPGARAAA